LENELRKEGVAVNNDVDFASLSWGLRDLTAFEICQIANIAKSAYLQTSQQLGHENLEYVIVRYCTDRT
jgi:hypothetical protein